MVFAVRFTKMKGLIDLLSDVNPSFCSGSLVRKFGEDLENIFLQEYLIKSIKDIADDYGFSSDIDTHWLGSDICIMYIRIFIGKTLENQFVFDISDLIASHCMVYGFTDFSGETIVTLIINQFTDYMRKTYPKPETEEYFSGEISILKCPCCGASLKKNQTKCEFCLSEFILR